MAGESTIRPRGDSNQPDAKAARIGNEIGQFRRLARPRQRKDHILGTDHAEIAVAGLGGVDEMGRRSG
jgi:hypothetical protein